MNKWFSALKRTAEFLNTNPKLYSYWALVTVFLFGLLGVAPGIKTLSVKGKTISELSKIDKNLEIKVGELTKLRDEMGSLRQEVLYIDTFMPDNPDVQGYMVDFFDLVQKGGFTISRFSTENRAEVNGINIETSLEGFGDVLGLIKDIEDLNRITQVEKASVSRVRNEQRVDLSLKIYFY